MTTNVPINSWNSAGFTAPDENLLLNGFVDDIQSAFNNQLNLDANVPSTLSTPQGQLAMSLAQIKGEINDNLRFIQSQINPKYAVGVWQNALAWLYFITRKPATKTSVLLTCTGLDGTVIPVGAKARDTSNNIYQCTGAGTILGGSVNLYFENIEAGAIDCPANSVNQIYQTVIGWESVNNANAGVIGQDEESQIDFEARRFASVAKNAHGTLASIYAAVFEVDGVTDVYAYENFTNSNLTYLGYTLSPHSIYIAVVGGNDTDVANAIWSKKDVGADTNGNISVSIKDLNYAYPQPEYIVKFQRPASQSIYFNVSVVNNPMLPNNATDLIKAAIQSSFNGQDGQARARIGSLILANRFTYNIMQSVPNCQVLDIDVSLNGITYANSVQVNIDKVPVLNLANISITYV